MFIEAGLSQPVRMALLSIIQRDIAVARRSRPRLEVQVRYGAAVNRPQMEMVCFVIDDRGTVDDAAA
jgi:hypothetical protein